MSSLARVVAAVVVATATLAAQSESVDALISRGDRERQSGQYRLALETYSLARARAEATGDQAGVANAGTALASRTSTKVTFHKRSTRSRARSPFAKYWAYVPRSPVR